ncbi:MAG: hypothetical protein P4M11_12715 [Candidatus Pacebacteria bacterium]|nr:hypothetical protein [Candidatus Paceibacterota bacterium]
MLQITSQQFGQTIFAKNKAEPLMHTLTMVDEDKSEQASPKQWHRSRSRSRTKDLKRMRSVVAVEPERSNAYDEIVHDSVYTGRGFLSPLASPCKVARKGSESLYSPRADESEEEPKDILKDDALRRRATMRDK